MQHVRFLPKTQTEEEVVPPYHTIAQCLEHTPRQSWADFPSPKGPAEALPLLLAALHCHARENREIVLQCPLPSFVSTPDLIIFNMETHKAFSETLEPCFLFRKGLWI